jgi:hypothetical protein
MNFMTNWRRKINMIVTKENANGPAWARRIWRWRRMIFLFQYTVARRILQNTGIGGVLAHTGLAFERAK